MTVMLVDLGLGGQIVGRTPFCDSIPESVPVVGSLLDVDYEKLLQVAPTHLLVQPAQSGTDPELERLAAEHDWVLIEQGLDGLEDVETLLLSLVASLKLPPAPEVQALSERCTASAHVLRTLRATAEPGPTSLKTLILVGIEPLTAAGTDTFLSEMFAAAGAANAIDATGYPELTLEDLATLDPEAIVLLRETAPSDADTATVLAPLTSSPTRAARQARVVIHTDPDSMLPSTRAPLVVERLRGLLSRWSKASGS
jgi:ABC-type hemin transport system substrate-binding protein